MADHLVIVTGASRGIGAAVAVAAPGDARVLDVSRRGGNPGTEHVPADLADPHSWAVVGARVADEVAGGDWLRITFVHAAGVLDPIGFAGETDPDDYDRAVLVNSASGQALGQRFLAAVRGLEGVKRDLVLVSSGAATNPYEGWSTYGPGKAALDHWVRTVGREQRRRGGVRVISVAPGVVATEMQATIRDTSPEDFPDVQRFHELHERGQLADPHDIARRFWALLDADPGPATGDVVDLGAAS